MESSINKMTSKLYGVILSPPVRAVLLCARALNIDLALVEVNLLKEDNLKEEFLKKNPTHTVPVLEDDDGFVLSDSHAILVYLVEKYDKNNKLYPQNDLRQKALINQRLHFDSSLLFGRVKAITRPLVLYGIKPSEEKLAALKEVFAFLERILKDTNTKFVAGDDVTIADFSIGTTVSSVDIFISYKDFPYVKAYIDRFLNLPYFDTVAEGLKQQNEIMLSKLGK